MNYIAPGVLAAAIVLLSGCASLPTDQTAPPWRGPRTGVRGKSMSIPVPQLSGKLHLADVVAAVRQANPTIRAAQQNVRIAEASVKQSRALPNPELEVEYEEFGGTGDLDGKDAMASTYALTQEIPLGGKRRREIELAQGELHIARLELTETAIGLEMDACRSFLAVYVAQESLALAKAALALVKQNHEAVQKKVQSGDVSPVETSKAKVEFVSARVTALRATRELSSTRKSLASLWGAREAKYTAVHMEYGKSVTVPDLEELRQALTKSPAANLLDAAVAQARRELALSKAQAWPDLAITGGVTRFREIDEHAYLFGISIPIPLFNRNQGAIKAAEAGVGKAVEERLAAQLELDRELVATRESLLATKEELDSFNKDVVPAADEAYRAVKLGFDAGEQEFLDVLDAQRTLLEMKQTHLELKAELQELFIQVQGLVGKSADGPVESPRKDKL